MSKETFLITGASDGIGAVYADRMARRGHPLILVARRIDKLRALAERIAVDTGVAVEVAPADLGNSEDLARIETRLRTDNAIGGLVNNAGIAGEGSIVSAGPGRISEMISLNVLALTRLTAALAPRFAAEGFGTIINISSVTALMPESFSAVYPATKAYVLAFSEALQAELGPKGVKVQVVLSGITHSAIWDAETIAQFPAEMVMTAENLVDASLAGLDLGETITVPSLPDKALLDIYFAARLALRPGLSLRQPADRYLA
jgi:short-subunit dehydrogenase